MNYKTIKEIDVEGVVLPNHPLSNFEVIDAAKKLKIKNFRGVFLRDQLPKKPRRNERSPRGLNEQSECGIMNLDDSSGDGTHYVAWYKQNNNNIYYFDGYGIQPAIEMINYLQKPIYYNTERIQPDDTVVCGHLCVFVLKKLDEGYNFQSIINTLF